MDAIFLVYLKIYIRAKMGFYTFQNLFQETLESSKSMVNLTNPWFNSKSMTNPWPCWRYRPKSQNHPKGGCIEPKFTRARNPWLIHDHADDADQKRKNRTRKAGASNRVDTCGSGKIWIKLETNRIHDHRIDKLWENATNQRWHISQILVFHWNFGKLESVVIDTFQFFHLPRNPLTIYQELGILERWQSRDPWYQFSKFLVLWLDKSRWRMGLRVGLFILAGIFHNP